MAGISLGGLSSGLDTASIVNQLMSVEANPQVLLQNKLVKQNTVVSALQGINARLSSLATNAAALAKPDAFTTPAATSSSTSVSLASRAGTGTGALTFDVTQLAQRAATTTAALTDAPPPDTARTFTISGTAPGFRPMTVTSASGNARDMALAINAADGDATASAVPTGAAGEFRLVVTAKLSGSGTLSVDGDAPATTQLRAGQDAVLRLGDGVAVTSRSNTFTDLLDGVDVTVSKREDAVTVSAAPDSAAVAKQAAGVVGSLNVVLSEITSQTKAEVGRSGPLVGSSLLRGIQQQLAGAMSSAVPGASLADLGIALTRAGSVTIDERAFAAYAAKDPAKAQALTAAFAGALATTAKAASETGTGTVSAAITSSQSTAKDVTSRIEGWDTRLALRRTTLERQFAALEVALQRNNAASSYLSGALAGLPGA